MSRYLTRDRLAGFLAAVSAAMWFDFFLTQPYERFTSTRRTDVETTVLLLRQQLQHGLDLEAARLSDEQR